jgi:hypothetical protein
LSGRCSHHVSSLLAVLPAVWSCPAVKLLSLLPLDWGIRAMHLL